VGGKCKGTNIQFEREIILRTNKGKKDRERKGVVFLIALSKTGERRIGEGRGSLGCGEEEEKRRGSFCL